MQAAMARLMTVGLAVALALSFAVGSSPPAAAQATSDVGVVDLQVENATAPLGLDVEQPRLSWRLDADRRGVAQTSYQVQVASSHDALADGAADVWDSGIVDDDASAQVVYDGPALESGTAYHWRVRAWDESGDATAWSDPSSWETGLLDAADWSGSEWVSHAFDRDLPSWGDVEISMQVTVTNNAAGVFFRADDSGNAYMWQLNTSGNNPRLRPHVRVNGGYSLLGEVPLEGIDLSQPHELTITAVGDEITTSIDGEVVDVRTDDTHAAGTIGFRTSGSERGLFDDVVVLEEGVEVFSEDFSGSNPFSGGSIDDGALLVAGDALLVPPHPPAPRLRQEFTLDAPVASARLYMSGLGYSVAHVNGERVGDAVLDPGHTDYEESVKYVTRDVTDHVQEGDNAIGVELGRGFYGITTGNSWNWSNAPWWSDPELRAMLVVTHEDGSTTTVGTDDSWTTSEDGPTRYDEVFVGETYDARMEQPGWADAGYDESGWTAAVPVEGPAGEQVAQANEPIRVTESIEPVAITEPEEGVYVFEFPVQIAGWSQLHVEGPAGTEVSLEHGERLGGNGLVSIPSYGNFHSVPRAQTDVYILSGDGEEVWEPSWTYKGFRFVEVRGLPEEPTLDTLVGRRVHNDFASIGHFATSNDLLNQIRENTRVALLNNHQHVPTDTPVYEKAGWTGDAQLTATTVSYEFDTTRFHTKYLGDFSDAQLGDGELPTIVPTSDWSYEGAPGWGAVHGPTPAWDAALFVLSWNLYQTEGDVRILEQHYEEMKLYFDWLETYADEDGLFDVGLGDWVAPGGNPPEGPVLSSTAYAYLFASRIADVAEILGDDASVAPYRERAEELYDLFNDTFYDEDLGHYTTPGVDVYRQTSNILPLAFDLVPDEHVDSVVASLVADIEARGGNLNTGVGGTRFILPVLSEHGETDVAYTVATQTDEPSWGYWVDELGRTSLQEHWYENTRSLNHHFFGSIGHWFFADLAGISPAEPGYAVARIKPVVPNDLEHAEGSTETVRGTVASSWTTEQYPIDLDVTIPPNARGEVHVPLVGFTPDDVTASDDATFVGQEGDHAVYEVGSGEWRFVVSDGSTPVCVDPDPSDTVVIGDTDTGVENRVVVDDCTIDDLIDDESDEWRNHGAFVSHVDEVTEALLEDGHLTDDERGRIMRTAARSDIGHGSRGGGQGRGGPPDRG